MAKFLTANFQRFLPFKNHIGLDEPLDRHVE